MNVPSHIKRRVVLLAIETARDALTLPDNLKQSHGRRRPNSNCNNEIHSSWRNPRLKVQWTLDPGRF